MDIRYLIGLIEGEGCFSKKRSHVGTDKERISSFIFSIGFHVRDTDLINKIRDFLGFGYINFIKSKNEKWGDQIRLSVGKRDDLVRLVGLIDSSGGFEGHKGVQYAVWKRDFLKFVESREDRKERILVRKRIRVSEKRKAYRARAGTKNA